VRSVSILAGLFTLCVLPPAFGQAVSLAQLRDFLRAQHRSKHSDTEIAERLGAVTLSQRLTQKALNSLIAESAPGPESVEQLRLLADDSIFAPPSTRENPLLPAPNPEAQQAIITAAAGYAQTALQHLPDFLAIRYTRRFDNLPLASPNKHSPPKIHLHWIGEFHDRITYRNGAETEDDARPQPESPETVHAGMISMGEFGPVLAIVFGDFAHGAVAWARWESDPALGPLAVFQYSVPKSASHYLVDFCCYRNSETESEVLSFRDHPAYHGEIALSPGSGVVRRITIQADLDPAGPMAASDLAVQYGEVEIGGQTYICPVRSIATTAIHRPAIKRIDGIGIERHLNEIQYTDYHKFGSTSRMITGP